MAAVQLQQDEQHLEGPAEESGDGMLAMTSRRIYIYTATYNLFFSFSNPCHFNVNVNIFSPFSLRYFA